MTEDPHEQPASETKSTGTKTTGNESSGSWIKILIGLVVLVGLYFLARQAGGLIPQFAAWVEGLGVWGPIVFIVGYAVAAVAFVPGSLLTLAAGAVFGIGAGTVYVFIGATLGATAAFLVARYIARSAIERRISNYPRFAAVDEAVAKEGGKIVFLLRLSPVFPFVLLNYALGLTRVKLRDYVMASLGMLPGTLLYVYYGKVAGDVATLAGGGQTTERGWEHYLVMGLGLVATIAVTTVVTRMASRALRNVEGDVDGSFDADADQGADQDPSQGDPDRSPAVS